MALSPRALPPPSSQGLIDSHQPLRRRQLGGRPADLMVNLPTPVPMGWELLRSMDLVSWLCPPPQMGDKRTGSLRLVLGRLPQAKMERVAEAVPASVSGPSFTAVSFILAFPRSHI